MKIEGHERDKEAERKGGKKGGSERRRASEREGGRPAGRREGVSENGFGSPAPQIRKLR